MFSVVETKKDKGCRMRRQDGGTNEKKYVKEVKKSNGDSNDGMHAAYCG